MKSTKKNKQKTNLSNINPIIKFLIVSDTIFMGAVGLLGPVFALFITGFITNGNATVAGIAVGIYLFVKSAFQIPVANLIDKIKGEKDDFWLMFIFTFITALTPLLYLFIHYPWQLYTTQFFLGLFTAFTFPSYMAIFTRHIDRKKEGTEWGIYYTLTDLASAGFATAGGFIATFLGYQYLIVIVVILSTIGSIFLWPIKKYLSFYKNKKI